MRQTDFVDDDLTVGRSASGRARADDPIDDISGGGDIPVRAISELSIGKLADRKQQMNTGMVKAINEIERLRQRKEELEAGKRYLEELSQKQEEYETGKREMIERLNEGIVALEKKELQHAQLTDLIIASRNRFKEILDEIENIDEESWSDDRFRQELYKALVIVDDGRMEYNKALAKIEVLEGSGESVLDRRAVASALQARIAGGGEKSFGYWMKVGIAVTLPVVVLAAVFMAAYLVLRAFNLV
jgi:hypothetical protein